MNIRNFCIIAHIDHGKSTLADRMIEVTGTLSKREMKNDQMLDTMELEQERGITIKLQPIRMKWKDYEFNMIDTPGHVDFQYEVSRSLKAVEGAILLVDASQGIEAQTLSNLYQAIDFDLKIIPVLNKIDLPQADPDRVAQEIEHMLGIPKEECIMASGKTGEGVQEILDAIIERIPAPERDPGTGSGMDVTKALVFDSNYDPYRGVISYVRVMEGEVIKGKKYKFLHSGTEIEAIEVGHFTPSYAPDPTINAGQIGYIVTGLKDVRHARVGDTVWNKKTNDGFTTKDEHKPEGLKGYKEVKPNLYAGLFASDASDYPILRDALEKLGVSDSSLVYEPENSPALGHGFRCGFLGLLHMEIVQERLEREFDIDLVITTPSVKYKIIKNNDEEEDISSPSELPDAGTFKEVKEPVVKIEIVTPQEYVGPIMQLTQEKRGVYKNTDYIDENRVLLLYEVPLAELITDFFDKLKSVSQGYASMNYEFLEYRTDDLVKVKLMLAGDEVDSLAFITHRSKAYNQGSTVCKKLKETIPKENFQIAIQAGIGNQVIARETISAYRKDVTGGMYGGDYSRKKKLLEKQKKGKKRMKQMGKVTIPQEAFLSLLGGD